jgi:CelD/BcsL family acetyltransferase involved in cellulose biosynthesis
MRDSSGSRRFNPFAREAVREHARHCRPDAVTWSVATADGAALHWPCRVTRLAPGLRVLRSPAVPLYDTASGPDGPDDGALALLPRLLSTQSLQAGWPHVLVADRVVAEGPVWDGLQRLAASGAVSVHPIVVWQRSLLDRRVAPDVAAYLAQAQSPARLKRLNQKRRALEKIGPLTLEVSATVPEVEAAFDIFCGLEAEGWKGRAGTALAQDPDGKAYGAGLMAALAREGNAFALSLVQDGRTIASALLLRSGGEAVFWKTTYDEGLSRHSPGVILDLMVTEWLYAQPWFETMDTGHDDSVDPAREIWSERRPMANVVIDLKPGSFKGRAVVAFLRARQALRAWRNRRQAAK